MQEKFTNITIDLSNDPDVCEEENARQCGFNGDNKMSNPTDVAAENFKNSDNSEKSANNPEFCDNNSEDTNHSETEGEGKAEEQKAKKLLHAVESLIDSNEKIFAVCAKIKRQVLRKEDLDEFSEKEHFTLIAKKIVAHYSDKSGLAGGVSGLPSLIPGFGSLIALLGSSAVDVILMLKFEIEMTLCLCHLAGFDITSERDRQLAFTLASVSSYDVLVSNNKALDAASLVGAAFWDYSLRQLSKYLLTILAKLACINVSKVLISRGILRVIPVIGVVVGASVNKIMTHKTGRYCIDALWARRPLKARPKNNDVVYEADFVD